MPKWHFLTITVYEKYPKITDIFLLNSVGIVTSRDEFVISPDRKKLEQKIRMFCDEELSDENIRQIFKLRDKSNWKLQDKRAKIRNDKNWKNAITQILYRPFDIQWMFYQDNLIERSRREVMQHILMIFIQK